MINNRLYNIAFLDLFSGSGAIGIEALSRGSREAYFVENNSEAVECIKKNISKTHLTEYANILKQDVFAALRYLEKNNKFFDIIFMDPPYNKDLEKNVLIFLSKSDLIDENSLIIVEASLETDFSYVSNLGFNIEREKLYKTNKHIFLRYNGE
jgi:16S rRNA (guanine966-N2)-methyltransferase